VPPYSNKIARAILKEPKLYFFDSGLVNGDSGAVFENMVAVSLLKSLCFQQDVSGQNISLAYLRTKDGEEVDFALVKNQQVVEMIETKLSDESPAKVLKKFQNLYGYAASQVVLNLRHSFQKENIQIKDAQYFLKNISI
jgi:hypothetical protein